MASRPLETSLFGVLEPRINILFVIVFPEKYKLDGVILSTVLAITFIDTPWELYVMFKHFFNPAQARVYLKLQAEFVLIAVLLSAATCYGAHIVTFAGFPGLVMKGIVAAIISGSITLAVFHSDIKKALASVLNRKKKTLAQ